MPNNTRTHTDGSGVWTDGYVTVPADWQDLERKIFGSWNGDRGGAYSAPPGSAGDPYVFTGSGLQVIGPTRLSYGGQVRGGSGAFIIRDGAWPTLDVGHVGRSRSIVCPIHAWSFYSDAPNIAALASESWTSPTYLWSTRHPYVGVGSVALACRLTSSRKIETCPLYIPLRVIEGSTLERVTLYFRIASKREFAPIAMPKMRVLRIPKDVGDQFQTVLPEPLKDTTDGTGYDFLPLVTSPADWYNNGEVQTFSYECDQNHEIDVANYHYIVEIIEEVGALTPDDDFDGIRLAERKQDVVSVSTNAITLSGGGGSRVLVVDSDDVIDYGFEGVYGSYNSTKNGIWNTAAGTWSRSEDADEIGDFTPNWIVRVASSDKEHNATWQCLHPSNRQRITFGAAGGSVDATAARPRIEPASPKGNIYHALVPTFSVTDLRFQ